MAPTLPAERQQGSVPSSANDPMADAQAGSTPANDEVDNARWQAMIGPLEASSVVGGGISDPGAASVSLFRAVPIPDNVTDDDEPDAEVAF